MGDYEQIMSNLKEMRSRFDAGFSSSDRLYIERLYASLLGKKVRKSGCSDCYRDAYLEIYHHLKTKGIMPKTPNYVLKAGVVVHPRGTNNFYANANIPDEVAENYLAEFPQNIVEFQTYPADYLLRVEARKEGKADEPTPEDIAGLVDAYKKLESAHSKTVEENEALKSDLETLKGQLADREAGINQLTAELEAAKAAQGNGDEDNALSMEVETLKADVETLTAENEALKKELETLKAAPVGKQETAATSKKKAAANADAATKAE